MKIILLIFSVIWIFIGFNVLNVDVYDEKGNLIKDTPQFRRKSQGRSPRQMISNYKIFGISIITGSIISTVYLLYKIFI